MKNKRKTFKVVTYGIDYIAESCSSSNYMWKTELSVFNLLTDKDFKWEYFKIRFKSPDIQSKKQGYAWGRGYGIMKLNRYLCRACTEEQLINFAKNAVQSLNTSGYLLISLDRMPSIKDTFMFGMYLSCHPASKLLDEYPVNTFCWRS